MNDHVLQHDGVSRAGFGHQAISAAAGTGKTYALTHRYIGLVQRGVPPERICALTFSRKAAGEIFDEIIRHLCASATNPARAHDSAREIGAPLQPSDFAATLRQLVTHIHRLHIGTIDSFIVGVVRAFPLELGIPPDFCLGDNNGPAGEELRRTLYGRLFDPASTSDAVRQAFLESFQLATFGQEQKLLHQTLEAYITTLAEIHRRIPAPAAWGEPTTIWGVGLPWKRLTPPQRRDCAAQAAAGVTTWPAAAAAQFQGMVHFLCEYDDCREWSAKLQQTTLFARLWQVVATPHGEPLTIKFSREELLVPAAAADALRQLVCHAMAVELGRTLRQTQGVAMLLSCYEALYAEHLRRSRQLGFDDLARLVAGGVGLPPSRTPGKPDHLFINYRLDATLDHWLLDEFQDTSDLQWQVLGNLIDETVQDDSGTRSFFYVGDVKQAIYGWRGGNHRLFRQVKEHYGDAIDEVHRTTSFRSAPVVIQAINDVFDTLSPDDHLPTKTLADWQAVWRRHTAARQELPGAVELIEAAPDEDESANEACYRAIATRLAEIQPTVRGWQVAVLLRNNQQARQCANLLRTHLPDMAVALEGTAALLDNPLVPLLLSLVRFAAHPGDQLAWQHLGMSPLAAALRTHAGADGAESATDEATRAALSLVLLGAIHHHGFQATLRDWSARLAAAHPFDTFTRLRQDDLLDAAAVFDATGDRDCDRFARFIEGYTRHDTAADTAIRVMTIHQSKGLGFDLVCVPFDPKADSFDAPGTAEMLVEEAERWVLKAPRQVVVESDPTLAAAAEHQLADAAFAKLCLFYVALTRAKQGLLLVVAPPPQSSSVVREDTLLRNRFAAGRADTKDTKKKKGSAGASGAASAASGAAAGAQPAPLSLYLAGDPAWHTARPVKRAPVVLAPVGVPAPLPLGVARLKRVEPSKQDPGAQPANTFFLREAGDVRVFGSAIHRLFQQIEWLETFEVEAAVAVWRASATETATVLRDVEQQFRASLAAPEVRQVLQHPAGEVELWREKAFELLREGELLAGQFDRVVIHRQDGRIRQVALFDFKSNRVEHDAALLRAAGKYREQMGLYAQALRRILGPVAITTSLIFTRAGRVVKI
ncbi:MAG: UvrD-helicase domain-containing protein [Kiritimatiellia bacterium]